MFITTENLTAERYRPGLGALVKVVPENRPVNGTFSKKLTCGFLCQGKVAAVKVRSAWIRMRRRLTCPFYRKSVLQNFSKTAEPASRYLLSVGNGTPEFCTVRESEYPVFHMSVASG